MVSQAASDKTGNAGNVKLMGEEVMEPDMCAFYLCVSVHQENDQIHIKCQ